jgi:hypothetical protein
MPGAQEPRLSGHRVIAGAVALIVTLVGLRAWVILGGWFQYDDFRFMSLTANNPVPAEFLVPYGGHLMPAGLALSWANQTLSPFDFTLPALELIALFLLGACGLLVLLVSAFGPRPGILAPLALYLTSSITLPASTWWAAGVNQLPFLCVVFWGTWTHLNYLRTRRTRWLVATLLITATGLAFYEKTLFVFLIYLFLALAYFASGKPWRRVLQVARTYWVGLIAHGVLAVAYAAVYVQHALNFDPVDSDTSTTSALWGVLGVFLPRYLTGVTGGPLTWTTFEEHFQWPTPSGALVAAGALLCLVVVYAVVRARTGAARALWLPALFLLANAYLVALGRASIVGARIGVDYRYQTELAAITVLAVALMVMPLRGAVESSAPRSERERRPQPALVSALTLAICLGAVWSNITFARGWHAATSSKDWFTAVGRSLEASGSPIPLVDMRVPSFVSPIFTYPVDFYSHMLVPYAAHTRYPDANLDQMYVINDDGDVSPLRIDAATVGARDETSGCPYPARNGAATLPLTKPVTGLESWVRVEFASQASTPMTVEAGGERHVLEGAPGVHNMYFRASGTVKEIRVTGMDPAVSTCFVAVEVGAPMPDEGELDR